MADDGMLHELQRQLDAFVASHGDSLVQLLVERAAASVDATLRLQASSHPFDLHNEAARTTVALGRLQWMSVAFARRSLCDVLQLVLAWTSAIENASTCSSTSKRLTSWLGAHVLVHIFEELSSKSKSESIQPSDANAVAVVMELVLDRCFSVFQSQSHSHSESSEPATNFFAFKSTQHQISKALSADTILSERAAAKWRDVLAWVSTTHSLASIRVRVQREIARPTLLNFKSDGRHHSKEHPFAKHLALVRLGIASDRSHSLVLTTSQQASSLPQRLKGAALFLKTLQPLMIKPTKSYIRLGIFSLVAGILKRELLRMDAKCAQQTYTTAHASEWNSFLSDLHALAMKSASKKKEFVSVGWELRVAVLCIAPNDIFSRYWKDDVHSLLRLQYQHNKDGTSSGGGTSGGVSTLECIGFCFSQLLHRHFLIERKLPSESDCMEIINTTQAWCFFSSSHKQKSSQNFQSHVLPVLVGITVDIASYNMMYVVQSHLRRLLTEAESIFDEKKLVGLESLVAICHHCFNVNQGGETAKVPVIQLDKKTLLLHYKALGDLVGHILIECNTSLGHELLIDTIGVSSSSLSGHQATAATGSLAQPSSTATLSARFLRDDFKRSLAIQTFGAALCSLEFLYSALELSEDHKMMLIARASIHTESYVRECAARVLRCIVTSREKPQAATVFRGLTDFVLRMTGNQANNSDIEACTILARLLGSLLQATIEASKSSGFFCWENARTRDESLLQVDAVCVYLLVHDDVELRKSALVVLECVRTAALMEVKTENSSALTSPLNTESPRRRCVLDVVEAMDSEVQQKFFSFLPEDELQHIRKVPEHETPPVDARIVLFGHLTCEATFPRYSFRWAMCLSMLFARLAQEIPEVTIYIWSDVNDKILKLEPVIPVSPSESESVGGDIVRWRNLSTLATASACPSLIAGSRSQHNGRHRSTQQDSQNSVSTCDDSVISSSAMVSLFKRLGKYLKSPSMEHRKAAILALGSTNPSAFPILVEVLVKYDTEAFAAFIEGADGPTPFVQVPGSNSRMASNSLSVSTGHWKQSRISRVKFASKSTGQLQLQWALGRCYRLLLERLLLRNEDRGLPSSHAERFLIGARGFLDRMSIALEPKAGTKSLETGNLHFMMQQDFCASLRAFSRYTSRAVSTDPDTHRPQVGANLQGPAGLALSKASSLPGNVREKLFYIIMSWCPSVGVLATSSLADNLDTTGFFKYASPLRKAWMQHVDVFGDLYSDDIDRELMIPSHWIDESELSVLLNNGAISSGSDPKSSNQAAVYQWYFLCQTAFAAMAALLEHNASELFLSRPILPDSPVFRWLDECFCVDTSSPSPAADKSAPGFSSSTAGFPHFQPLQAICFQALETLLTKDFATFGPICIEKALFTQPQGDKFTMSKHYFRAVSDKIATEFEKLWTPSGCGGGANEVSRHQLLARFFHAALLHISIEDDEDHRVLALRRLISLLDIPGVAPMSISTDHATHVSLLVLNQHGYASSAAKSLPVLVTQSTNRVQVAVSSLLALRFLDLAFAVSASLLRFISVCDVTQQRKLFATALPWLAGISLTMPGSRTINDDSEYNSQQLLSLLFRLTKSLSSSCGDQLEHAWLTLAFSSQSSQWAQTSDGDDAIDNGPYQPGNLAAIIRFVFFQRASTAHLATSKTVFWWLSRWQSAAVEVIGVLVDLVGAQRRRSALGVQPAASPLPPAGETRRGSFTDDTAALQHNPLNDIAVLLMLLSDSSCNLLSPGHDMEALTEMAIQISYYALMVLFASVKGSNVEPCDAKKGERTLAAAPRPFFEASDAHIFGDIIRDCLLVLRNVLPLLQAPQGSIEPLLLQLRQLMSETPDASGAFEVTVESFAQTYLSTYEITVWSEECAKEFALVISLHASQSSSMFDPAAVALSPASMRKAKLQGMLCLRFALTMHRLLAAPFHGDVFQTLMELLHFSLDEQNRDLVNVNALACDCLMTLRAMVTLMPFAKLVLYPQILWVCVALLNHCTMQVSAYHSAILDLLLELLSKPQFFTSAVLQDVLMSKRPQQWSKAQSSVLQALALNAYCCADNRSAVGPRVRDRALTLVMQAVTFNCSVLIADAHEHAVICTITLLPLLSATVSRSHEVWTQREQLTKIAADMAGVWQDVEGEHASQLTQLLQSYATREAVSTSNFSVSIDKELVASFATAFVQYLHSTAAVELNFDGLSVSFEILLKAVECCQRRCTVEATGDSRLCESERRRIAHAALSLVEEMLKEMEVRSIVWRMPSSLMVSLVRLLREPQDDSQWQVTVRITSHLGSSTVSTEVTKAKFHLSINTGEATTDNIGDEDSSKSTPKSPKSAQISAPPSVKKDSSARKFINLMTRRTTSPSTRNSPTAGHISSNNNNNSRSTNDNNNNNSCGSSSSIVGGHSVGAQNAGAKAAKPVDPSEEDRPPPPPSTPTRSKLFRL